MTKSDIEDYMIVETGYDDCKYLVMNGKLVDDNLQGFSLEDFDENLVNKAQKQYSISKVYDVVKLNVPFELCIEQIFAKQNPQVLWVRQPTPISLKYLKSLKKSHVQEYLMNIVYPCVTVE